MINKEKEEKNVTTIPVKVSGDLTVVYRLLCGYSPECDGCIYSLLLSLYENGILTDEEFAFDITRDGGRAAAIFDLAIKYETLPSSFCENFEDILDIL